MPSHSQHNGAAHSTEGLTLSRCSSDGQINRHSRETVTRGVGKPKKEAAEVKYNNYKQKQKKRQSCSIAFQFLRTSRDHSLGQ